MSIVSFLARISWKFGTGTLEEMDKFSRRTVKVTREHNEECRRLLKLMGIPVVIVNLYSSSSSVLPYPYVTGSLRSGSPMCGTGPRRKGTIPCFALSIPANGSRVGLRRRLRRYGHPYVFCTYPISPSHFLGSKKTAH